MNLPLRADGMIAHMTDDPRPITVAEYEPLARARTDPGAWDYQAGGAGDELSLADNRTAWARIRLRPRVMVDVSSRDLSTNAFGVALAHPIIVAPTAAQPPARSTRCRRSRRPRWRTSPAPPPERRAGSSSTRPPTAVPARHSSNVLPPPATRRSW